MSVGVVIATFGDRDLWGPLAERAMASVQNQTIPPDWVWVHDETLQAARNRGADLLGDHEHLIFLDADDELDPQYVSSMIGALCYFQDQDDAGGGFHGIYRPSTIGVYEDGSADDQAVMIPRTDLKARNCVVIGAMCPSELFFQVGGFDDYPVLEDWALWRKMRSRGASIVDVPRAVYRVHVRPESRNSDPALHGLVYSRIKIEVPL